MFGLAPSATKEGAKEPQYGTKGHGGPSAGAKRWDTECSELLVIEEKNFTLKPFLLHEEEM